MTSCRQLMMDSMLIIYNPLLEHRFFNGDAIKLILLLHHGLRLIKKCRPLMMIEYIWRCIHKTQIGCTITLIASTNIADGLIRLL